MTYLDTLTDARLERLYAQLYARLVAQGGAQWGLDWPTMKLTNPHTARVMRECLRRIDGRVAI